MAPRASLFVCVRPLPRAVPAGHARVCRARPRMSGVNGGIDYQIDLHTLPAALAARIASMQHGADSPAALISAAEHIARASREHPQTLPVLVDVLGFNNPAAARIAIDALVRARGAALPPLLAGVGAFNYSVNAYALRALGAIGDPSVRRVCEACAAAGPIPNVRRAACAALGALRYATPPHAAAAYRCLLRLADAEPDWGVRYAAIVALERFARRRLLHAALERQALLVLAAAARGHANVLPAAPDAAPDAALAPVPFDATVAARATLALQRMSQRSQL